VLFVKLRQMPADDRHAVVLEAAVARCIPDGQGAAHEVVLHETAVERVSLVRWPARYTDVRHDHPLGEEILLLEGDLADEHGRYAAGTWLRQPPGSDHASFTRGGCLMWMKRGPR
jgi:anti-sigma factor ChrR (cupin superfamily)